MAHCPYENYHEPINVIYSLTALRDNKYKCNECGCVFQWFNTFHWKVLMNMCPVCKRRFLRRGYCYNCKTAFINNHKEQDEKVDIALTIAAVILVFSFIAAMVVIAAEIAR